MNFSEITRYRISFVIILIRCGLKCKQQQCGSEMKKKRFKIDYIIIHLCQGYIQQQ